MRQLLTESAVLALCGGVLGLGVAIAGVQLLDWLRPTNLPRQSQIDVDAAVAIFAIGLSAIVCVICGVVPALRITRREQMDPLRSGRTGASAPGLRRLQRGLVVAEVALSIVPLIGGGLMLRSFWNLTNAPLGFDPSGLVTAKVQMSFRALQPVLPGYLSLTRTPLIDGRDISDDDLRAGRLVAVVDQRLASRLYPEGALGSHRTQEFGVRMALGATAGAVMAMVAKEGALLSAVGATIGMAVALGVAGSLRGLLYGVAPLDTTTVAGVAALMAAVAIAAASVPAWRAARVDPTTALRTQ